MAFGWLLLLPAAAGIARAEVTTNGYSVGWISHFFGESARTVYSSMNVEPKEGCLKTLELNTLGFKLKCYEFESSDHKNSYYCEMRVRCDKGRTFCSVTEGSVFATYRRDQFESPDGPGAEELNRWWHSLALPVQSVGSGFVAKMLTLKHPNPDAKEPRFVLACRSSEESPEAPEVCQVQFPRENQSRS